MKQWIAALGLLLTLTACSIGPRSVDASRDIDAGLCNWKFAGETNFEEKAPGAGTASSYNCYLGGHATLYRYTLGKHDWTVDATDFDPLARATVADVLKHYKGENATVNALTLGKDGSGHITLQGREFRGYRFDVTKAGGQRATSYLLLTAHDGGLLKYRVTFAGTNADLYARILQMLVTRSLPATTAAVAPVTPAQP